MTGRRPELDGLRELQEFDSNRRRRRGVRVYGRGREAPPGQGQSQPDQKQGEDAVAPTLALGSPRGAVGSRAVGRLSGPLGRLPVLTSLGFLSSVRLGFPHQSLFLLSPISDFLTCPLLYGNIFSLWKCTEKVRPSLGRYGLWISGMCQSFVFKIQGDSVISCESGCLQRDMNIQKSTGQRPHSRDGFEFSMFSGLLHAISVVLS